MEGRGRSRGYGRARGGQQGGAQQRPGGGNGGGGRPGYSGGGNGSGRPGPAPTQPPPQGSWVRPMNPGGQAWARPPPSQQPAPPVQSALGRGARQETAGVVSGGGDQDTTARQAGGGTIRGRVVRRNEIIVTRPPNVEIKKGTSGSPINLTSNYFPLEQQSGWTLYRYRVDFVPDVDIIGKRRRLVRTATQELFKNGGYLFDGTMIFTPRLFNDKEIQLYVADDDGTKIQITIKLINQAVNTDFAYIQIFNLIVRKCLMLMDLHQIGRHFYDPKAEVTLRDHNLKIWPGYVTSMRQHEKQILLNVDLQSKVLRTDSCYDMFHECQRDNFKREFQEKIIGSVVLTKYNNKTYRVDDVDFQSTPKSTFKTADGSEISYMDYYSNKYKIKIYDPTQPMLVSRSKPREIRLGMPEIVYLVPELCLLTGLTDRQRENFHLMKAMAEHTRVGVEGRIRRLQQFSQTIHSKREVAEEIRRWDLNLSERLIQLTGRVLPPDFIVSGTADKAKVGPDADWTRDIRSKPMLASAKMTNFVVITPQRFARETSNFLDMLQRAASGMRWSLGQLKVVDIRDDRPGTYIAAIDNILSTTDVSLLFIVLSNNSTDRYKALKKKCYVDRAIPTQMVIARNLSSKGAMSIATKIVIQMNCKVGGAPWSVPIPLTGLMVVGYDVCRDTQNKKQSFAGMVATLDKNLSRYYSLTMPHQDTQEISTNFGTFMVLACKEYYQIHNSYPDRILVYRDGVGEGQVGDVKDAEISIIKTKLKEEIYRDQPFRFGFVIVSKRINTRLFADNRNPPPGTIVDDVITLPERYDFYLVSQCVRQGTVSPTCYSVLEENLGLGPDKLQMLTYKLTHLYYNWSGTVRVPAPCQNAHKLAFLTSQALHRQAHAKLSKLLYYL